MIETIELTNFFVALGALSLFFSSAYLVFDLKTSRSAAELVRKYALLTAFFLTLSAGTMSLVYSEIFGFVPCGLCWLTRTFMYPQIFVSATALWIKDSTMPLYGIVLSVPGFFITLYQHYLQMGGNDFLPCPATGTGTSCAEKILFEFGFMTFPLVGTAMFTFLIVLYYYLYKLHQEDTL